ncbi:MAG: hypothetical protein HC837_13040 [Chloroflexaceae bacterium]|nr:hypothetical protein [Chloroflexaceae bacterium]
MQSSHRDLLILAADKDTEYTLKGLLPRHQALGIRPITYGMYVHPEHDPGCFSRGHDFLRPFIQQYHYALVMLDREGCGHESQSREQLEQEVEHRLSQSGWHERSVAIVLDPELEIWVWSDSSHVERVLGWEGRKPDLRTWLVEDSLIRSEQSKPDYPKPALEKALRIARKPRSSSLYTELAKQVSFRRCVDPAFLKLWQTLQTWFPVK